MGAVPSRESLQRGGLCQLPKYGQRHQMVLVPLTKAFFPSPSCTLLTQLLEARRDPFVRYYQSYDDILRQGEQAGGEEETVHATGDNRWQADALPPFDCTPEKFYEAYICRAGESLIFDTDEEMLEAYTQKSHSIRPLPCAVTFVYNSKPATTQFSHVERNGDNVPELYRGGEDSGQGDVTPSTENRMPSSTVGDNTLPGESVELCGLHLRAVGFIGDVSALQLKARGSVAPESDYQLQMFLNKSVGDHNYMHVLFTALYTYAVQWRDALMARGMMGTGTHLHAEEARDFGEQLVSSDKASWPTPPVRSVITSSRRTNVPMLCFLRSVRSILVGMDLVLQSDDGGSGSVGKMGGKAAAGDDRTGHTSSGVALVAVEDASNSKSRVAESDVPYLERDAVTEEEFMTMWLKNDVLFAHIPEDVVARAIRYVVRCICHQEYPLDVLRTRACQKPPSSENDLLSVQHPTHCPTESVTVTTSWTVPVVEELSEAMDVSGDVVRKTSGCVDTTASRILGKPVVVEEWPEEGLDLSSLENAASNKSTTYFYWVVGNSVEAQRSASVAISLWKSRERSVKVDSPCAQALAETGVDIAMPMVSVGELLHIATLPPGGQWQDITLQNPPPLQLRRAPLEELLLAELQNACRWAREADVNAENWVRCAEGETRRESARIMPTNAATEGGDSQAMAAATSQLVGEGALCLWCVPLGTRTVRIIAVAPHFLRSARQRRQRRRPVHHQLTAGRRTGPAKEPKSLQKMVHMAVDGTERVCVDRRDDQPLQHSEVLTGSGKPPPEATWSVSAVLPPAPRGVQLCLPNESLSQQQKPTPQHPHCYHASTISNSSQEISHASFLETGASHSIFMCSKGTKEEHDEIKIFDNAMDSHGKNGSAPGSGFSSNVYSALHVWDNSGTWGQHTMSDEARNCLSFSHRGLGGTSQLLSPFQSLMGPHRTCVFDHHQNGPSWLTEQCANSICYCTESGSVSPTTFRQQDPHSPLPLSGDDSQTGRDEFSNVGIHVTVRHGLQHYRTPSSLNYSDTNSSHETTTTKHNSGTVPKRQSSQTGGYRWDWRKCGQHDYWEDL